MKKLKVIGFITLVPLVILGACGSENMEFEDDDQNINDWQAAGPELDVLFGASSGRTSSSAKGLMVFPKNEWASSTPEAQGVDSKKLEQAIGDFEKKAPFNGVQELVIVRNGYLIWKGKNVDNKHGVWSCTKNFTSTVLGLLIDDGKIKLDTPLQRYLPELEKNYSNATFKHFTTMTSGYFAEGDKKDDHGQSQTPFNPSSPLFSPPGTKFAYWDSAMNQLAHALTKAANEPISQVFKRRIADPIGMKGWKWGGRKTIHGLEVSDGAGNGSQSLEITARQLAKFGLLFLNRGAWNGKQLVNSKWVDDATKNQVSSSINLAIPQSKLDGRGTYGFNWWTNDGKRKWPGAPASTYAASGYNNNKLFVIPDWNMVIVRLGQDEYKGGFRIGDDVYSNFLRNVGNALSQSPSQDCSNARIAISADGNQHDSDDWGATPATLALLAKREWQHKLVHYDFNNHLGDNDSLMAEEMRKSTMGAASRFGFDKSRFFNDQTQLNSSINNLSEAINASSPDNPLCIFAMGPMEVIWRGIDASDRAKRRYVKIISHSEYWNDVHADTDQMQNTREDVEKLGVQWVSIRDQNGDQKDDDQKSKPRLRCEYDEYRWMRDADDSRLRWIYERMRNASVFFSKLKGKEEYKNIGDISDSGIAYFAMTGKDDGNPEKYRTFFGDWVGDPSNDLAVKGFTLIDALTDSDLRALTDGGKINLSQDGSMLNIRAEVEGNPGSVVFSGLLAHTESTAPYALAGDDQGDYHSWKPKTGNFTLTATPYSLANGEGQAGKSLTISFGVSQSSDNNDDNDNDNDNKNNNLIYDDCEKWPKTSSVGKKWHWRLDASGGTLDDSSEQARAGKRSYKITYNSKQPGKRVELVLQPGLNLGFGKDYWYGYSVYIPANWQNPTSYGVIGQWHKAGYKDCSKNQWECDNRCCSKNPATPQPLGFYTSGSSDAPTFQTQISGMDEYFACNSTCNYNKFDYRKRFDSPTLKKGAWNDVVVHYRPVYKSAAGKVEVWLNGNKYVDVTNYTAHNDDLGPYFKLGLYATSQKNHVLYIDEIRIMENGSYAQVVPRGR